MYRPRPSLRLLRTSNIFLQPLAKVIASRIPYETFIRPMRNGNNLVYLALWDVHFRLQAENHEIYGVYGVFLRRKSLKIENLSMRGICAINNNNERSHFWAIRECPGWRTNSLIIE